MNDLVSKNGASTGVLMREKPHAGKRKMRVALSLTHDCNLSCAYCYSGTKYKREMSFSTASKAVDFVMNGSFRADTVQFGFFGGEPLLCFENMKRITEYIQTRAEESGIAISLNLTTNGTLLDPSILNFLKEKDFAICISIDGPKSLHDRNRKFEDGRGSFDNVVEKIRLANEWLESVQVNAVYGAKTLKHLPETVAFLSDLGVSGIHLNPDVVSNWYPDANAMFLDVFKAISDRYIKNFKIEEGVGINLIDSKIILLLKGGYGPEERCSMGELELGFSPSGNIYPCERLIGDDQDPTFCIGSLTAGIDKKRLCSVVESRGNSDEECKDCTLQQYCMNWCGCTNYFMTGKTDQMSAALCASERASIAAANNALFELKDNDHFIAHLMQAIL